MGIGYLLRMLQHALSSHSDSRIGIRMYVCTYVTMTIYNFSIPTSISGCAPQPNQAKTEGGEGWSSVLCVAKLTHNARSVYV